jgi:hypothetical protein
MKQTPTPSQRQRLADQKQAAAGHRSWHESRVADFEKRAAKAAAAKAKAGPSGGRLRALAILAARLGTTPVTRAAVQLVDRDRRGRVLPHRNLERDRSLRGKARIRARKAARR